MQFEMHSRLIQIEVGMVLGFFAMYLFDPNRLSTPSKPFLNRVGTQNTSRDISTLAKRWILYFRFMGKSPDVGFLSDTEQSTYFLRSIQEPALISQAQSLLVSIINKNQMQPVKLRGRAPLPTHLKINALSDTLAQTIQPLENELGFAPAANHTQYGQYAGTGWIALSLSILHSDWSPRIPILAVRRLSKSAYHARLWQPRGSDFKCD